jgi:hypothetical protein
LEHLYLKTKKMSIGGYKIRNQAGMLRIFKEEGTKNSRIKSYRFWRQDNQPQELYSPKFVFQKINYMHYNPVIAGIVERSGDYLYSSAKDYHATKKCRLPDLEFL